MEKSNVRYDAYIRILEEELVPAMGCTEPIAIAYGAAKAREVLGRLPERMLVEASGNIIKNVKSVVVPNTGGLHGIEAAAAAGVVAGKPELLLEVISQVTPEQQEEMRTYLKEHPVRVEFLDGELVFDIQITLKKGEDTAKIRIANYHTNIVHIEHNGNVLLDLPVEADDESGLTDRTLLNMADIYDFAQTVELGDVREIIGRQIQCNMAISQEGLTHSYGANIGQVIRATSPADDPIAKAKAAAAAGSDARMGGCEMPVIINSGSGNQGMTASVPVIVYGREKGVSEEKLYRALVLSNLIRLLRRCERRGRSGGGYRLPGRRRLRGGHPHRGQRPGHRVRHDLRRGQGLLRRQDRRRHRRGCAGLPDVSERPAVLRRGRHHLPGCGKDPGQCGPAGQDRDALHG